jgi:hypothetical protein
MFLPDNKKDGQNANGDKTHGYPPRNPPTITGQTGSTSVRKLDKPDLSHYNFEAPPKKTRIA